jgi:membrane-bound ClpP family serine protease
MSITVIIILILLGILLFLIEFLLVPGITVAGIGGAILIIGGVILSYHYHGSAIGNYTLLGTALISFLTVFIVLKSGTWRKIMLQKDISGKVNVIDQTGTEVKIGDVGKTVTRLNPIGKVVINGNYFEAQSLNKYIDQKTDIEVIKVLSNKLVVKLKN